ncbi:DUF885 family protein [Sphingomonas sp. SUN039]|uniref:DUF885 domain-containing protein n=1 Tax=Sphingomonas sp. SUN039 TaxID=2937787 RepID=UPI0021642772|nr:DUF885 domain-containing protein [Sphingomonas sp. SUN039]UVO54943.1 DUF885 domain-containing protein [Sphingomonas sp. SUN039]
MRLRLAFAAALAVATPALATPSTDLKALIDAHWDWAMSESPTYASALGDRRGDGKLGDISLAAADRSAARADAFAKQLAAIPDTGLSASERTDKAILLRMLTEQVEGNGFGQRMMLFTTYAGWHQNFAGLGENSPFNTVADYGSYLARLAAYPALNGEAMKITRAAVAAGYAQPCAVLGNVEASITGLIAPKVEASRFYKPFLGNAPQGMASADWTAMKARAATLIRDTVEPEYRKFAEYYAKDYKPKCRATVGISATPQGEAYYALQVRIHTTTNLTPDAIHNIGLSEVARIRAEMDAVAKGAGFPDRAVYVRELRTNPKYFAKTPNELLAAAARQAKTIDGLMPRLFGKLPRLPYGLRPIPAETAEGTTTAYYNPGSPPAGIAGFYYVNTSKLDQRPLWELPALTAHEAVPGHHNQIALQQEMDLPKFRRYLAGFTAYTEGWGLYSEHLGIELGLYDTPEKNMGRLSYEMWRACRLVVDTGLHSKGWTKAQAVTFMRDNTALTDANIDAEVNRYISWPGQALGYKLGELKLKELRARAEKALGPKFDVRAFHDAVLSSGAVPLDVLEANVAAWVAASR